MARDIKKIISQMTLEEKASLCSGEDRWNTRAIERLGIPSIMMSDGPHGLRKQMGEKFFESVPSTCFPSGSCLASSWDRKLLEKVGIALGEECQAEKVSILLGPSVNIKRSPLCGRNFEYYSEDPYLSSELAASYIKGVQSQGVGTSIKHYAANNQEHRRLTVDAKVDKRTLREIYLASFEGAVKQSQPWTVMCAYNKVNGKYCAENKYLLTDILKEEWGHEGFVISDWGAVNERVDGLNAGLELEMPSSYGQGEKKIIEAVKSGKLDEEILDKTVERLLTIIFKAVDNQNRDVTYDREAHHQMVREVARQCMVLLKNEDYILPLKKDSVLAVIGAFAKSPRYQGGGSSHINPIRIENAYDEIIKIAGDSTRVLYASGYKLDSDEVDENLISEAKEMARQSDVAVVFAGLPDSYESEAYDRKNIKIPESHSRLIEAVAGVNDNMIVVLSNGSPVEMPWLSKAKAVLEGYLSGQAGGGAMADLLFGIESPSGKLAETFPLKLSHNPSYLNYPGEENTVEYREGIFIGYRYYDTKDIKPLFPFGHGLSYTNFSYTGISLDKKEISDSEIVNVTVKVKNTGKVKGKEVVQLYVRDVKSSVIRPEKELKGFVKVELEPGEEKKVTFTLGKRAFAYYNVDMGDWHVESGDFEILVGGSSRDMALKETVSVKSSITIRKKYSRNSTIEDLMNDPIGVKAIQEVIEYFKENSPIMAAADDKQNSNIVEAFFKFLPLRGLITFSNGAIEEEMINKIIQQLNDTT
ncbi:MAG: glycoside hydrolase family 3 C-terminal domain-containing protein [Actinobacteria bacterium]|nr:glycoside hydrolase family 3 C-terminal domain-containing protein [Actinomycetota bacterium]